MSYEFEKYCCDKDTLAETLQRYGVAIIPSVLDEMECDHMVSGIWDFLEHLTHKWEVPLSRSQPETWREFYQLYPLHSMLLQHWGVGHAQVAWDVRQNPKIIDIFSHFWKSQDLLVSFDGMSFNLPPEITKRGWNRTTWYHTDQSYTTPDFQCVQSWITGLDVNENDATLSLREGSHLYHQEFQETFRVKDKKNWYKLNDDEEAFYVKKGCVETHIKCPKGSLVLWDSRTIHCGTEARKKREHPNFRAVIYLCYMPRSFSSPSQLKKKQKALLELRTTTHSPCQIKLFGKSPRTYGGVMPHVETLSPPRLTEVGKRLAGL